MLREKEQPSDESVPMMPGRKNQLTLLAVRPDPTTVGPPRNAGWDLWHSPDAVGVCPPYRWTLENEVSKPSGRKGQDNGQQLPPHTYAG